MKHHLLAMITGTRGGPSHLPAEQSTAALALIRTEHNGDLVSVAASLRRANAFLTEIGDDETLAPASTAQARQASRLATPAETSAAARASIRTEHAGDIASGARLGRATPMTDGHGDSPGVLPHFVALQSTVDDLRRTLRPRRGTRIVRFRGSTVARQMTMITSALTNVCEWMHAREASHLHSESSSDSELSAEAAGDEVGDDGDDDPVTLGVDPRDPAYIPG